MSNTEQQQIISRDKTYKLRNGWQYKLYNIISEEDQTDDEYIVHGAFFNKEDNKWVVCEHTINGTYYKEGDLDRYDLIESTPYDHIKIDDKVIVWNNKIDDTECHRHFAGVNDAGKPMCWRDGKTSFTTSSTIEWDNCELFIE